MIYFIIDNSAKDLIYNPIPEETAGVKKLYSKTHGLSDPGSQRDRNYNWHSIDKKNHVFGKFHPIEKDGAKLSLITDFLEASYPKTKIVDKRLEDFRQASEDMIGKSKFKGTLKSDIDENFVFGLQSFKANEMWNVGKCLYGDPDSQNTQLIEQDKDLGKSISYKSKLNIFKPKECEVSKVFGLPTIRYDLPKKKLVSVTDWTVINIIH